MKAIKLILIIIALAMLSLTPVQAGMDMKHGHGMSIHHQHQMLNHSLGMALQGSDLIMLGQMKIVPGLDDTTIEHGKMMLKNARSM